MIKIRNLIGILIIGLVLLFSGCDLPGLGNDAKTSGLIGGSSSSGSSSTSSTGGVKLTFSDGNPPSEMYNDQSVTFGFIFTNYQEHEVSDLKMKVSGFDKSYVSGLSEAYNVQSIPKSTSQSGPGVFAGLAATNVQVKNFNEKYNFNPQFNYCYTAKSTLVEQVCVPSKQSSSCEVQVDKMYKSNGPLVPKIDSIINKDNGGGVRVFFSIANKGDGKVVNTCFKEDYANKYSVIAKLGTQSGSCQSVSGEFNIITGKASFYCDFTRSGEDSYASQITVELTHLYEQSVKKTILVKDLNKGY